MTAFRIDDVDKYLLVSVHRIVDGCVHQLTTEVCTEWTHHTLDGIPFLTKIGLDNFLTSLLGQALADIAIRAV